MWKSCHISSNDDDKEDEKVLVCGWRRNMKCVTVLLSGLDRVLDFIKTVFGFAMIVDVHCSLHAHPAALTCFILQHLLLTYEISRETKKNFNDCTGCLFLLFCFLLLLDILVS